MSNQSDVTKTLKNLKPSGKKTDNQILIQKLMYQYMDMFNDTIPLMWLGKNEQEIIDLITECIRTKTPFDYKKYFPEGAIL